MSFVDGDRLVAAVPDSAVIAAIQAAAAEGKAVGIQRSFDETSFQTMFEALDRTIRAKGRLGYLRDLFYAHQKAETFSFAPMRFPYLNATQEKAVNRLELYQMDIPP